MTFQATLVCEEFWNRSLSPTWTKSCSQLSDVTVWCMFGFQIRSCVVLTPLLRLHNPRIKKIDFNFVFTPAGTRNNKTRANENSSGSVWCNRSTPSAALRFEVRHQKGPFSGWISLVKKTSSGGFNPLVNQQYDCWAVRNHIKCLILRDNKLLVRNH